MEGIQDDLAGSPARCRQAGAGARVLPKTGRAADHLPGVERDGRVIALGGIAAVLAAAVCCGLSFLLLAAGAVGAWIGSLTDLGPYLPVVFFVPLALAGVVAWRRQRKRVPACGDGGCVRAHSGRIGLPNG